jgi:predicted hydrocarbon binding protein
MGGMESEHDKPVKMDDFFTLNFRTGAVHNQLTDERVHVIPALRWKRLREKLAREFGEQAPLIMSYIGSSLGSSFAEELIANISDPEALARHLSDVSAAAGWGILSMIGDTRYGSRYLVTVTNCIFCEKEGRAESPRCDFLVGAVKGMADSIYGTPHKVWEERCEAMGESVCQLVVEECSATEVCEECRNSRFCEWAHEHEGGTKTSLPTEHLQR